MEDSRDLQTRVWSVGESLCGPILCPGLIDGNVRAKLDPSEDRLERSIEERSPGDLTANFLAINDDGMIFVVEKI